MGVALRKPYIFPSLRLFEPFFTFLKPKTTQLFELSYHFLTIFLFNIEYCKTVTYSATVSKLSPSKLEPSLSYHWIKFYKGSTYFFHCPNYWPLLVEKHFCISSTRSIWIFYRPVETWGLEAAATLPPPLAFCQI